MTRRLTAALSLAVGVLGATMVPALQASSATSVVHSFVITSNLPTSLSNQLPLLRLHFSDATKVKNLPALRTRPALATKWEQISTHEVQAVVTGSLQPAAIYTIDLPTRMTCATSCPFTAVRPRRALVASSTIWEEQLLAELNYLPVTFTPSTSSSNPTQPTSGTFTWKYPKLPASIQSQWRVGVAGVLLRGALMNFQSVNNLPTTGIADAPTWSDLITELRLRKSATEVEYVRKAALALDASFEASFAALRPGVREKEVLGCALKAMMDAGGEVPAIVPPLASGPRTLAATHGAATNRVLKSGDLFQIEVGAAYQRYNVVGVHSKWLGVPPPEVHSAFGKLRDALDVGIGSIRTGVPVAEVARKVNAELEMAGMYIPGRHIGYGTGIGYPPTWLDNLRVKETDQHVLEANMLLFLFLHHQCDDGVSLLFIGEPILVKDEGADRLSTVPFSLEVN